MRSSAYIFELRRRVIALYGCDSKKKAEFWEFTDQLLGKDLTVGQVKETLTAHKPSIAFTKSDHDIACSSSKSPECFDTSLSLSRPGK